MKNKKLKSFIGIAGYYSMQALNEKMIGMSMTNTSPLVYPTRSNVRTFGTNPLTLAAPAQNNDRLIFRYLETFYF
jgi:LDH2 family malate/lactate/ureidoglycolate dehydrogenase